MKKIKSLFKRDYEKTRLVINEVIEGSEWVINGEGLATRKWDGTSCLIKDGKFYKRYDAKNGKTPPEGFIPAQEPDLITGHWPGWIEVKNDEPSDKRHIEGFNNSLPIEDGTYELCGVKVQNNSEKLDKNILIKHGIDILEAPRDYDGLKEYLSHTDIEGIVWHHSDGRMVKIKKKDFGFNR